MSTLIIPSYLVGEKKPDILWQVSVKIKVYWLSFHNIANLL